jgi:hypothetical protein
MPLSRELRGTNSARTEFDVGTTSVPPVGCGGCQPAAFDLAAEHSVRVRGASSANSGKANIDAAARIFEAEARAARSIVREAVPEQDDACTPPTVPESP